MVRAKHKNRIIALTVTFPILVAYVLRLTDIFGGTEHREFTLARSFIYIILFSIWGVYTYKRIVLQQIRRNLSCVAALMVFWITIRAIKYSFDIGPNAARTIWYSYYLPIIFIPLLLLFIAMSLGKAEGYRLPNKALLLLIPAFLLLLAVLTNDFHQLVFLFPADTTLFSDSDYRHEFIYYLVWAWSICCTVAACVIIVVKCNIPGRKKLIVLPVIPISVLLIYGSIYLMGLPIIKLLLNDFTVVFCLLIAAVFESFLHSGLIQSNTHYSELFRLSGIRAKIFDSDYNVILSSPDSEPLSKEIMQQTESAPVLLDGGVRLSGSPIKGGFVMWSEDVSELAEVLDALASAQEDLQEETALLRENYNTERRIRHLEEQNRLYDEIHRHTAPQIGLLADLICEFESESDDAQKLHLLRKMIVVGVYLKRRSNLVFIGEQNPVLDERELSLCFEETMSNLELSGIECGCYINLGGSLSLDEAVAAFDFYELVAEAAYDSLSSLLIRIFRSGGETVVSIGAVCDADLSFLESEQVSLVRDDESVCSLTLRIPEGGVRQ